MPQAKMKEARGQPPTERNIEGHSVRVRLKLRLRCGEQVEKM